MADFIATLVAPQGLAAGDISAACDAIGGKAGPVTDGIAVQIGLIAGVADRLRTTLETLLPQADVIIRPADAPFPRLLVADMDSTMISVECIDELADYAGIKPQIAAITERAMQGELDFAAALRERVACLAGLDEAVIEQCLAERVRPMPGAETLIRTLGARGTRCVLVSGGFTRFTDPVAAMIGFQRALANVLEIEGGRLTGQVIEPIVDSATKRVTLEAEAAALGATMADCIAVGDGANDIPMIAAAGLGIAYHGHAKAVAAADAAIRAGDHTSLLYALGVPRAEWVSGLSG
jgi:phosphoserine phosphatase